MILPSTFVLFALFVVKGKIEPAVALNVAIAPGVDSPLAENNRNRDRYRYRTELKATSSNRKLMGLGHERLDVYRLAIGYVAWVFEHSEKLNGTGFYAVSYFRTQGGPSDQYWATHYKSMKHWKVPFFIASV